MNRRQFLQRGAMAAVAVSVAPAAVMAAKDEWPHNYYRMEWATGGYAPCSTVLVGEEVCEYRIFKPKVFDKPIQVEPHD